MPKNFLQEGPQTAFGETVMRISEGITGKTACEVVFNILRWMDANLDHQSEEQSKLFRKRTAEQILQDSFGTGCTDFTLVFVTLARAKGVPTKYVELLKHDWLTSKRKKIDGHVVAEVYLEPNWYYVDPTRKTVSLKPPSGFVLYERGLDSWNLDITHENWRDKFLEFRKLYQKEKAAST